MRAKRLRIVFLFFLFVAASSCTPIVEAGGSTTIYVTKTGSSYHRGSCRYLSKSKISISLIDAVAKGYSPCSVCKPPRL